MTKPKNSKKAKLSLNKRSLRTLDASELDAARGGRDNALNLGAVGGDPIVLAPPPPIAITEGATCRCATNTCRCLTVVGGKG